MRKLAHISDLHFGRIDEEVVEALLVDLRSLGPDLIVVSGDLNSAGAPASVPGGAGVSGPVERSLSGRAGQP